MIVSSAPGSDAGFKAVNAAFEAAYPNVTLDFAAIPNQDYQAAEASRLTAGTLDLIIAQPVEVPSYAASSEGNDALLADNGQLLDLTGQPFLKRFTPSVIDAVTYKKHNYTVPTGLSYFTGVYYNKAIFAKYNLTIPTTWTEFLQLAQTLKSNGVSALGIGGKDSWPAGLPMNAAVNGLYPTNADKTALAKALWSRSVKLTDPQPKAVLTMQQQLYGLAQKNFAGVGYNDIPAGFANGQYAMTPDGTWNNVTIATAVGSKFDIGYFPIPTSDVAANNALLNGKIELTLAIPSSTKNKAGALAYLDFFSQPANYALFLKTAGFAPSEPNIPLSPFLNSISQYTSQFRLAWGVIWTPNLKAGNAAAFPFDYVDIAPMGTLDADRAAAAAQKAWDAGF